jgi:putative ABC transport system permease protein
LLTEAVLLAEIAGAIGALLAAGGTVWLNRIESLQLPRFNAGSIDFPVLGFTFVLSLLPGVIFGLAPALAATARGGCTELNDYLKESGRGASQGRRGNRLRNMLVVSEIALALTLLVGAGLMARSLIRLLDVNRGFRSDHVETAQVNLPYNRYPPGPRRVAFYDEVLRRARALPPSTAPPG